MAAVSSAITGLFDLIFWPSRIHPWLGMVLLSLITGFVLLFIFRYTSNQKGIRAVKDRIMAHLLEVLLHRDELRVVLRAQMRLFGDNLRYLGYALVPLAFMVIPVGLLLVQTDLRYGHRPLRVGEASLVQVKLGQEAIDLNEVRLRAPEGIAVETASLRMLGAGEVDWRVRARAPGRYQLTIEVAGETFTKALVVESKGGRVSTERLEGPFWRYLVHPGEAPLRAGEKVDWIKVSYPAAMLAVGGWEVHWVWVWLVLSMIFGFAFKGPLGVQV